MPKIKPLAKLVNKARDLRDGHQARHRPSGFGFALSDSIDYLDAAHWDAVTVNNSLFLSPRYLRVLEHAGPDNLRQRYALIFRGRTPVAAVAAQSVTVSLSRSAANRRLSRRLVSVRDLTRSAFGFATAFPCLTCWCAACSTQFRTTTNLRNEIHSKNRPGRAGASPLPDPELITFEL